MNLQQDRRFSFQVQRYFAPAHLEDFEVVMTLFGALHGYNTSFNEKFALASNWREVFYNHFMRTAHSDSSLWLIAWIEEQPAGLLILEEHCDSPLFQHRRQVELVALYVDATFRGTGLAQHLMREAQTWAQSHGETSMQLYVTTQNERARAFYRRCGWYPVQEIWHVDVTSEQGTQKSNTDVVSCGDDDKREGDLLEPGHHHIALKNTTGENLIQAKIVKSHP
ncbi:MAG: GNAT family N-acetyltransferase [Ktedonobacteraceae bacterium]|nr:GNAT family N-acetyltransferase [Ktedonobacteraceae bacterium]